MKNVIERYKNGDEIARELLIDEIVIIYKSQITREEATLLLHKRHGIQELF